MAKCEQFQQFSFCLLNTLLFFPIFFISFPQKNKYNWKGNEPCEHTHHVIIFYKVKFRSKGYKSGNKNTYNNDSHPSTESTDRFFFHEIWFSKTQFTLDYHSKSFKIRVRFQLKNSHQKNMKFYNHWVRSYVKKFTTKSKEKLQCL